jgi:signal transduction histidine kinase
MKCLHAGYDQPVGMAHQVLGSRTRRTVAVLRAAVAALVALHVVLLLDDLRAAGLLAIAAASVAALAVSCAWGLVLARSARGATMPLQAWTIAAIDALALVAVARVTVEVDPDASIVWAFVLWVPFSIAVRATTTASLVATTATALGVAGAVRLDVGPLHELASDWTTTAVPALLVLVAGGLTAAATRSARRTSLQVRRELEDERDRALRLREADDLKNTFLSAVSHELRTPLTSILGFTLTMLDRPDLDDRQRDRMLRTVVDEAEHLEDILANLLDLDRLTRGKAAIVATDVDPSLVVQHAVDTVRSRSGRPIDLDLATGFRLPLDVSKVERIIENLVGNAVKYTPEGAAVHVTLSGDPTGIVIRVDDSGPGICPELRESIFEPFQRGTDIGVPGTGIGLSLVDRFSRMHGGRAWVEERPGGGCRFQVYLAAQQVPTSDAPSSPRAPERSRAARRSCAPSTDTRPDLTDFAATDTVPARPDGRPIGPSPVV